MSDEFRAVRAVREALPTRAHAEMAFAQIADLLGARAWIESEAGGAARTLYLREEPGSPWIVPWPVAAVTRGGREGPSPILSLETDERTEPTPRPGTAPKIRGLGPGQLDLHDGPHRVTVSYGADGRWFECACSDAHVAFAGVVGALATRSASAPELIAAFVASLDHGSHGPGRVQLPVAIRGGVAGAWRCGLYSLRNALFGGRVPQDARWVVADGWTGAAVAAGATRDEAMSAWRAEVVRIRPFPARPAPPPETPSETPPESSVETSVEGNSFGMRVTMHARPSDVPWVEPTVENSPAAAIPLGPLPADAPPLGAWTRLIGARGEASPAALRRDAAGFTLAGDLLLRVMAPWELDPVLDAADRDAGTEKPPPPDPLWQAPPTDTRIRTYRLADEKSGALVKPRVGPTSWRMGFDARDLDGDRLRGCAVRCRPGSS